MSRDFVWTRVKRTTVTFLVLETFMTHLCLSLVALTAIDLHKGDFVQRLASYYTVLSFGSRYNSRSTWPIKARWKWRTQCETSCDKGVYSHLILFLMHIRTCKYSSCSIPRRVLVTTTRALFRLSVDWM